VSKGDKILQQMQNNPLDWRQRGTSHVVFVRSDGRTLPVPAHRPIKPIYIKKFVDFVME
jgi:predicted RNA binding protein YcfA (HicA-like mRNA interferase family)